MSKFDPQILIIRGGERRVGLEISQDYMDDPDETFLVLLYTPDRLHDEHFHIEFSDKEALSLANYILKYLDFKQKYATAKIDLVKENP